MRLGRALMISTALMSVAMFESQAIAQQTASPETPNQPSPSRTRALPTTVAATLPQIDVNGARGQENTQDRYLDKNTTAATKTDTPILETSQSVSIITRRQIDDQNPQTVANALRYTAGVLSDADTNARYDSIFIRGFGAFGTATNYVSYLDGLKLPRGQAFANTSVDPFLLDRLEVLKGPSAVMYGQMSPGGIVNQVSRMPSAVPYNEIRVEGGTYGRIQSGVTSQGAIDKDAHLLYSISAIGRFSGTRYDNVREERYGVAPALTWQPDNDTRFTLLGYYQHDPKGGYFNSLYAKSLALPQYQPFLNSHLNAGDPGFDSFNREQYGIGYQFEHRLNETFSVYSTLRYSHVALDFKSLQMDGPLSTTGLLPRWALRSVEDVGGISMDNRVQWNISTGPLQHHFLTGIDYQNSSSNWEYQLGGATSLDVVNPVYYQPTTALASLINSAQDLSQTGLYGQDQISFGQWRASLGIRHDWTDQDTANRLTNTDSKQSAEKTTYRAGLLYLFDNGLAPYFSYSTSFEPTSGVGSDGNAFKPTTGEQYEVGVKYQPPVLPILLTTSLFDIRQQNVLTPSSVAGFSVQQGEIHSRGIELEARGNVTADLEVVGAFTFLDTRVSESTDLTTIGRRPQAVPNHFGSLWANYSLRSIGLPWLAGFTLGAGVRYVGDTFGDDANTLKTPSYIVADASLKYDLATLSQALKGAELTFNVTNLFDKEYYSSCSSNYYCQYANRRQVLAGLRYRW